MSRFRTLQNRPRATAATLDGHPPSDFSDAIQWKDEGVPLGTSGTVTSVNITGIPITATRLLDEITINIPSSLPTTNGIVYWDGTKFVNSSGGTFDGTTMIIAANGSNLPSLRVGPMEHQSLAVNNTFFIENGTNDGANLKYRANGFLSALHFSAGQLIFYTAVSGLAGNVAAYTPKLTITNTGDGTFAGSATATLFSGPVTALKSATTSVVVSAATPPSANQALIATSSTAASWQTIAGITIPIPIAQGGTNATAFGTTNALVYFDGTRLVDSPNGLWNGSVMTITGTLGVGAAPSPTATAYINSGGASSTLEVDAVLASNAIVRISSAAVAQWSIYRPGTTTDLRIRDATTDKMYFAQGKGVGINATATPTADFYVVNGGGTSVIEVDGAAATNTILRISSGAVASWSLYRPASTTNFRIRDASTDQVYFEQGGAMGMGGAPNANAILDVQSTTKAFMPPRMTTTQKNAIASPTASMTVYDSTLGRPAVYNTTWQNVGFQQYAFSTSDFPSVTTSFANVTALTLNLIAGQTYQIVFTGVNNSTGTGLFKVDFNGGSATVTGISGNWLVSDDSLASSQKAGKVTALSEVITGGSGTVEAGITVTFTIKINAGGTLIPRFAQSSLDAGNPSKLEAYASITATVIT